MAAELTRGRVMRACATTPSWMAAAMAWDGAMMRSWSLCGQRRATDAALRGARDVTMGGVMPTAAKRRCDAEGLWAVPAAARRDDYERRRAATFDGFHRLARAVSPRSARRPSPLVTMRCARACGDIRSGVTGGLSDGVAEPARSGRAAAGVRRVLRAWRWQACGSGKGQGEAEPTEQQAKRRGASMCSTVSAACRMGDTQREVEVAR